MRRSYWIALGLVAIAVLAAAITWIATRPPDEPTVLRVAAGPRGSDGHTLMTEVSQVVARYSEDLRLTVVPTRNSAINANLLRDGEVELATIEASTPPIEGLGFVADLFPDFFVFIVRAETGVTRIEDLADLRIAVPEPNTVEQRAFWSVISHYGVPPEAFRFAPTNLRRASARLLRGEANALFTLSSIRDPSLIRLIEETTIRRVPIRFLPVDQAAAMALKRPFLSPTTIVKGAFSGQPPLPANDVPTAALHRILVASDAADEEAVAELTRVLFENRLDLVIRMPLTSAITGREENGVTLPLHPGAQRFYDRDKPSFLQENAEPMAFIVTILGILASALLALRRAVLAKAKNRADKHNITLLDLSRRAREAATLEELRIVRGELFELMEQVVEALDRDDVTEEGFQSFSAIWESVRSVTRDRREELTRRVEAVAVAAK